MLKNGKNGKNRYIINYIKNIRQCCVRMPKLINPKLLNTNLIRRFSSSRRNAMLYKNNIVVDQLIEQNKSLKDINSTLVAIWINTLTLTGLTICVVFMK
jgi:RNase adaptor protein for sRNA GlmZ degradation